MRTSRHARMHTSYLPTYPPTYLPTCLPAYLRTCIHHTCMHTYIHTKRHTHIYIYILHIYMAQEVRKDLRTTAVHSPCLRYLPTVSQVPHLYLYETSNGATSTLVELAATALRESM